MTRVTEREAELLARYVEQNPHASGIDEARLVTYGVPIWAIVGHWRAVGEDPGQVAREYDLPEEAVEAALVYYRRHRALIDGRILANKL